MVTYHDIHAALVLIIGYMVLNKQTYKKTKTKKLAEYTFKIFL